jgi:CarD family transcriptional regulator
MLEKTMMKQVLPTGDHLMKWQVGERVVYPSHGVGEIVSIEANELFGPGVEVYVLELMQSNKRRVMISTEKAENGALRPIVDAEEAQRIIMSLKEAPNVSKSVPWTKRKRILLDKLSSCCLQDVADVLRELYHLKDVKDLSFGQRRLFDTAIALIVQELSVALNRSAESVEEEIRNMFV